MACAPEGRPYLFRGDYARFDVGVGLSEDRSPRYSAQTAKYRKSGVTLNAHRYTQVLSAPIPRNARIVSAAT